jgi:hypothetical protein
MSGVLRQGKIKGRSEWINCGNVTFEDAAITVAQHSQVSADQVTVIVRDAELPDTEFELKVELVRAFKISGLRGGE